MGWDTFLARAMWRSQVTSNGKKSGGDIVFRKWTGGTSFTKLAKINSDGDISANNIFANNVYTKEQVDSKIKLVIT